MGGQSQQSGAGAAAPTALYDRHHSTASAVGAGGDAGDAVMARWLQSAGLQHLASPMASSDHRLLPNLLMQGYGPQSVEEKQKLLMLFRNLNYNGDSGSDLYIPAAQSIGQLGVTDGFYSPELRGEFGAGLLDIHAMDDNELLSEHVFSEPFEPSPVFPTRNFDNDYDATSSREEGTLDNTIKAIDSEKESSTKENNVAKIKVVVRKRPLNQKEISRKEDDIVSIHDNVYLAVHEPKLKVDLTAYVEKHEFCFDAVLDEHVTNDEVYRVTVEPIIPTIFQRTKATCFAYGQTGSGKTFTMKPLPLRAAEDIVHSLRKPMYRDQNLKLWLSYFEIYGGKLFDLLSDRRKLCTREDGKQQVCIVGLHEFEVSDVQIVKEFIEKGNAARSTGSTGVNEESSRSHAILQLAVKKHKEVSDSKRRKETSESKAGKVVGKISFIDLAGSERGADTTDNDRQTRIEGAEINKSLLALKECIRALDNDQIHIPFRGSKLTEVLRDSFVGNSKTVMISCISPNAGSCEHTLNTLRYADRVKSLSKSGNSKKDQAVVPLVSSIKGTASSFPLVELDANDQVQESKAVEVPRTNVDTSYLEKNSYGATANLSRNAKEKSVIPLAPSEREKVDSIYNDSSYNDNFYPAQNSFGTEFKEKVPKVSPPRRKVPREEKLEKQNWSKKENGLQPFSGHKSSEVSDPATFSTLNQHKEEASFDDGEINALLEEEEALIAAHRKEIENTMEIVHEEMNLLTEVDRPGSQIESYVTQLSFVLSRKAAGLVSLQARLARFQQRLKEQEILGSKKGFR